jgi:hypothetical protein
MKPTLTLADYQRAALALKCEEAAIMAVADVESSGNGFYTDGSLKKLFEPSWFKRLSGGKTASTYSAAYKLDPTNAMKSTSWGKFQIMGFHYADLGFKSVEAMVAYFTVSEVNQLNGFIAFIRLKNLEDELRTHNWAGFAYLYNGENYAKLGYHTKIAEAYGKYKAEPALIEKKKSTRG